MRKGYQSDHVFSRVPRAEIPRSSFSRNHGYKTTFDSGYLIPFYVDEALPGDTFNLRVTLLARLATPLVPLMDNMHLDVFFFAVPHRLLWENWQKFCGEQVNPGDSTSYMTPVVSTGLGNLVTDLSLGDYMGLPVDKVGIDFSALPFRAYTLIWNEWFRDQNLQNTVPVPVDDGPDLISEFSLLRRGKRHDYFTSCLPWPQKGDAVTLPLGAMADVLRDSASAVPGWEATQPDATIVQVAPLIHGAGVSGRQPIAVADPGTDFASGNAVRWGTDVGLYADLSTAEASSINAIREAFQVQRLMERDARGGTRYTEIVKSHFGVTSPDARLQRPEYLGGGSLPVIINAVAQTSSTDAQTPQGNLAAFGTASGGGIGFTKSFTEHCVLIGLVSARADLTYQQGLRRMWSRRTRYDFYWPSLAHLGEQAVLNREIYAQGDANDELVFGYQERWAEYRYFPSLVTGQFRSTHGTPLDFWHLAQEYSALPVLGATFIQEDPPVDRVTAVPTEPHFIFDSYFEIQSARPMPVYSVPGLVDHF